MNILFINILERYSEGLIPLLMRMGYVVYSARDTEGAMSIINNKDIKIIFMDIDVKIGGDWIEFLKGLCNLSQKPKIIIHSANTEPAFIKMLIKLGISGFILKNLPQKKFLSKFIEILRFNEGQNVKRQYVRVKPSEFDTAIVNFRLENIDTPIYGKIMDISMGGVAFEVDPKMKMYIEHIIPGQKLMSVQFSINSRLSLCDLLVVAIKDNVIAARFINPNENFTAVLARYIYEKLAQL